MKMWAPSSLAERLGCRAAAVGSDAIAEFVGELEAQVAEAADSLYRHQISRDGTAVAQSVEGGDAGCSDASWHASG
jgi:hypothetical protein